ncbi:MAG: hypothetical protein IT436_16160 [Phycisphaerales bacterium]|nr:hypothetical protein [Phycisphaerales bacterium]
MGLKGINPFEQHVEKVVVGISGAALLVVLAMQFMGGSSAVKVGKGPPVPPADAYKPVEQEAQRLAARLESGEPELPPANKTEILSLFESKLTSPVAPRPGIVALGPAPTVTQMAVGSDQKLETLLATVTVPAPAEPVAHAFRSTISPFEWFGVEDLRRYLPAQQPFDKAAVSVEATFDGTAFKKVLTEDPDGDGPLVPLPLTWWRDGVEIVGVELEREQLGPDGGWGGAAIVKSLPGRADLIAEVPQMLKSIGDVNPFLARVRSVADEVQRPPYYETIAGPKWTSPVEAAALADEGMGQGPEALVQKVARFDAELADLEQKMAGLPTSPPPKKEKEKQTQGPRGGGGGGGGGGGKGGAGEGGGGRQAPQGPSPETTALRDYLRWQTMSKKSAAIAAQREAVVAQLAKQGLDPLGQPVAVAPGQVLPSDKPLLDNEAVKVWGHDITVEPGSMYRYRTRIVVNNPMFGRGSYLLDDQKPLAEEPLVRGEWSEWSSPVQVDANGYFFIVSASEQDAVAGKRATAELYQFYYGYWRKGAVNVEPGDPLVAEAKLPAELPIFDLSKLATLPPPPPGGRPLPGREGGDEGGGGRGIAPGGDEGGGRGRAAPPPEPPPPSGALPKDAPPPGVTFAPAKMAVGVDALFLDVAPVPSIADRRLATGGGQLQAFLRDAGGQIITRIPDHERKAAAYRRVAESAKAGETQGKPVVRPVEGPRLPPPPGRQPGGDRPPPGDGGGGGGGG